jgi:hypothetical protein
MEELKIDGNGAGYGNTGAGSGYGCGDIGQKDGNGYGCDDDYYGRGDEANTRDGWGCGNRYYGKGKGNGDPSIG